MFKLKFLCQFFLIWMILDWEQEKHIHFLGRYASTCAWGSHPLPQFIQFGVFLPKIYYCGLNGPNYARKCQNPHTRYCTSSNPRNSPVALCMADLSAVFCNLLMWHVTTYGWGWLFMLLIRSITSVFYCGCDSLCFVIDFIISRLEITYSSSAFWALFHRVTIGLKFDLSCNSCIEIKLKDKS